MTRTGQHSLSAALYCAALALIFAVLTLAAAVATAADKPVIEKKDDLPRHNYQLDVPVTALYEAENRETLMALADQIRSDILGDLETYDIQDDNTLQGFYGVLGSIALLEEDAATQASLTDEDDGDGTAALVELASLGLTLGTLTGPAHAGEPLPSGVMMSMFRPVSRFTRRTKSRPFSARRHASVATIR